MLCNLCTVRFERITDYNNHQVLHKNDKNLMIPCAYLGCTKKYTVYSSFIQHVNRYHRERTIKVDSYTCTQKECNFHARDFRLFKIHLYRHFNEPHNGVLCSLSNCVVSGKKLYTVQSLRSHIFRVHRCEYDIAKHQTQTQSNNEHFTVPSVGNLVSFNEIYQESQSGISLGSDRLQNVSQSPKVENLARLYLNSSAKHFATETILQPLIAGIAEVFEKCSNNFVFEIQNRDKLSHDEKSHVLQIFQNSFRVLNEVHNKEYGLLRTTHMRKEYYRQKFNYVAPEQVNLTVPEDEDECHYHYVPILDTLKKLLENDTIRYYCEHLEPSSRSGFSDFTDGNVFKNNDFFVINKNGLKIILYQDAFKICNPIGSSKGKFKIIAVYMILGNLPPHLRSKTSNGQLVLLCLEKHVTRFGWVVILERLIKDLNILAKDGITPTFSKQTITFKGTVILCWETI